MIKNDNVDITYLAKLATKLSFAGNKMRLLADIDTTKACHILYRLN